MIISSPMVIFIANREGEGDGDKKTPGLQPYLCPANVWTWGFGHAIYHEGRRLEGEKDRELAFQLFPGGTRADAVELLKKDLMKVRDAVLAELNGANVNQCQFDAMCSLMFNIGRHNFAKSSLLRYHRRGFTKPSGADLAALERGSKVKTLPGNAPDQFAAWSYIKGGTVWVRGLYNRRIEERAWYLKAA